MHLLVDSTRLNLCGSGGWLLEKHGTKTRRSRRKLRIAVDADTGQIAAAVLPSNDDASQVGALLDQVDGPAASFNADGAYDHDGVYGDVVSHRPEAFVIVPPRSSAVPSDTTPTWRKPLSSSGRASARPWRGSSAGIGRAGWAVVLVGSVIAVLLADGRACSMRVVAAIHVGDLAGDEIGA